MRVTLVKHVLLRPLLALLKRQGKEIIHTNPSKIIKTVHTTAPHNFFRRTASLEDRMHHLETLIKAIPPAVFAAGGAMPHMAGVYTPFDQGNGPNSVTPFTNPGVPPPSLHVFPLINPSTHFSDNGNLDAPSHSPVSTSAPFYVDNSLDETSRTSLTSSYLYFDDEGYTRWQGETSGLPVLDLLVEKQQQASGQSAYVEGAPQVDWFPDRQPRRIEVNPQALWKLITSYIVPELMDRSVVRPMQLQITDIYQSCAMLLVYIILFSTLPPCAHISFRALSII